MFDVTFLGAFVAGLLSFLSPCILPMVPFYLSYLAGQGVHVVAETGKVPEGLRRRAITGALFFALGVITVFVGLGATATLFGQLVRECQALSRSLLVQCLKDPNRDEFPLTVFPSSSQCDAKTRMAQLHHVQCQ